MPEILRPGDTLIAGIPLGMAVRQVQEMKEKFREMVPGCEIIYIGGVTGMAIYRPEPEASDA